LHSIVLGLISRCKGAEIGLVGLTMEDLKDLKDQEVEVPEEEVPEVEVPLDGLQGRSVVLPKPWRTE